MSILSFEGGCGALLLHSDSRQLGRQPEWSYRVVEVQWKHREVEILVQWRYRVADTQSGGTAGVSTLNIGFTEATVGWSVFREDQQRVIGD